jgi:hypothetical protein
MASPLDEITIVTVPGNIKNSLLARLQTPRYYFPQFVFAVLLLESFDRGQR